jgi:ubiquinone/menaquinone biosynthesis C-methylase UbiE
MSLLVGACHVRSSAGIGNRVALRIGPLRSLRKTFCRASTHSRSSPYPPEFFRVVAERLELGPAHSLIDLGTGPGLIAVGFAPYVRRVVGVDPEPAMLGAARQVAGRARIDLAPVQSTAERLPPDLGPFEVVTIGRALHWMDRGLIGSVLERLVAPGGVILVCSARSAEDGC